MSLSKDARKLLSQLPGRHPHLESAKFLTEPDSFYQVVPDDNPPPPPPGYEGPEAPPYKVELLRPEWLGPEPTIVRVSDVPGELANAYEVALAEELLQVYWDGGGDAHIYLTAKGRAALADDRISEQEGTPAEADAYVLVSKLWPEHFDTYRKAKTFLDEHPEIKTRKPSDNRLEVHAADWIKHWTGQQTEPTDEQIEDYLAAVEQRKIDVRQRK